MNVFDLCESVEERDSGSPRVVVDPATLYPAIVARIQAAIAETAPPAELMMPRDRLAPGVSPSVKADAWIGRAQAITEEAWNDALTPREALPALPLPVNWEALVGLGSFLTQSRQALTANLLAERLYNGQLPPWLAGYVTDEMLATVERRARRAYALDFALAWFQQAMRVASPTGRVVMRITRNDDYKLV